MGFFSRLFNKGKSPAQLNCPRCLGKGHVDRKDIVRLKKEGEWEPGTCAYCNGSGSIDEDILSKVPVDAAGLTSDLSEPERNAFINNSQNSSGSINQKRDGCPVSEYNRLWLEDSFLLLLNFFGKEDTQQRKVLIPRYSDFPIQYNGSEQSAYETMKIVATQMGVYHHNIELGFYDDHEQEVSTGSPFGGGVFLEPDKDAPGTTGLYWGQQEHGKYEIWLNRKKMTQSESMVATLAHEIAHIKLLGENRMEINNENLTDLTTVIFGLGIFNANQAFQTYTEIGSYGWQSQGYLSQMEWGYALALFAFMQGEKSPAWINHLTPNVKNDFLQGQRFIEKNPFLIFQSK